MSELYHPTSHAQEGSVSSIQTMEQYREIWNRSTAEGMPFGWSKPKPSSTGRQNPQSVWKGIFILFSRMPIQMVL